MEALLEKSPTLTTEQAHSIAVDAYVYFYSLVTYGCDSETDDEHTVG